MRQLAEELYERTKNMISDIAIDVIKDHGAYHDKDRYLISVLNEYYTLWNNPVKIEHDIDSAKELISRIERDNASTLHNKKLSDKSRLAIVVLYRSTLAHIFYQHWNMSQDRIGTLFNKDRSTISYMVSNTRSNIWYYRGIKKQTFQKRVISYLFLEAGLKDPFD
jgi:hypothetical protein